MVKEFSGCYQPFPSLSLNFCHRVRQQIKIQAAGNSLLQAARITKKSVARFTMSLMMLKASDAQSSFQSARSRPVSVPQSKTAPQISIPVYGRSLASCTMIMEQMPKAWPRLASKASKSASRRRERRAQGGPGRVEMLEPPLEPEPGP